MKRFFLLIAFSGCLLVKAQSFEGMITYQISYPTITDKAQLRDLPTEMTLSIKGNRLRSDIEYFKYPDNPKVKPTIVSQSKIVDLDSKSYFVLLSVGNDNKLAIETTTKQIEENLLKSPTPNIVVQDSTKSIKGYLCKIAILTVKTINPISGEPEDMPLTIYYTEAFGNKNIFLEEDLRDINGLLLEYTIFANKIPIKFTATKIKKKKNKDIMFERPIQGYQTEVERESVEYWLNNK
jgi:hypothetical protein